MSMETEKGPEQEPEKYSFLQETIKDETFDRKKLIRKMTTIVGKGLLFGVAASISFFAVKPVVEKVTPQNTNRVEIPKDAELDAEEQQPEYTAPKLQPFSLSNFREMTAIVTKVSLEAQKCVVEVAGVTKNTNLYMDNIGIERKSAGLIVADNGQELLILTNLNVLNESEGLRVKFADATECQATLKKKDGNIGMAVIAVPHKSIQESTWGRIKVATLGNSYALNQGKTVIALGNPFGYSNGMGVGIIGSSQKKVKQADGEYTVLVTDMPRSENSSGILFNIDGEVIGVISPGMHNTTGVMAAYGISSIKNEIELLSNAKEVPYIGIVGTMISEDVAEARNMPEGLCVTEVEAESPAMLAGIQNGDVILKMGKTEIESVNEYYNKIMESEVGTQVVLTGKRRGAEGYVDITFTVVVGTKS